MSKHEKALVVNQAQVQFDRDFAAIYHRIKDELTAKMQQEIDHMVREIDSNDYSVEAKKVEVHVEKVI